MDPARCPSRLDEYYQKFLELQNKLKKSEEQRFLLEMKFNETVQMAKEEEQAHYRKLRAQYKRFLEEDKKRQDRNERIIRHLERIETRIAMLSAKTERINMLRRQYQSLFNQPTKHQPGRPNMDAERPIEPASSNEETIQILDQYLENISSQRCRDLLEQEEKARKSLYWERDELMKINRAASLADGIMDSICSKHYNRDPTPGMVRGSFTSRPDGLEQAKLPEPPVKKGSLGHVEAAPFQAEEIPPVQQEITMVSPLNQLEISVEEANETEELEQPKLDVNLLPQTEPSSDQASGENHQPAVSSLLEEAQDLLDEYPIAAREPDYPPQPLPQQEVEIEAPVEAVANIQNEPSNLDEQNNEAEENQVYDPNEQQHYQEMAGYDQYGQVLLYDQHGQPVPPQYDETGQIVPHYDANGQPVTLYDQTGQQYDQNRQPAIHYDENGQPVYEYYGGEEVGAQELEYGGGERTQADYFAGGQLQSSETQRLVDCGDQRVIDHEGSYSTTDQPSEQQLQDQRLTSEDPELQYGANEKNQEDYYAGGYQPNESQLQLNDEGFRSQKQGLEPGGNEGGGQYYSGEQLDEQGFEAHRYDESQQHVVQHVDDCVERKPIEDDNGEAKHKEPEGKLESQDDGKQDEEQPVANVMDILDTDTESVQQNISKVSNDTDFDFS